MKNIDIELLSLVHYISLHNMFLLRTNTTFEFISTGQIMLLKTVKVSMSLYLKEGLGTNEDNGKYPNPMTNFIL